MKDMTEMKNQIDCINDWIKRKDSGVSKAAFCKEWGTSPRSLGRWIEKYEVHCAEEKNQPSPVCKFSVGDVVKVTTTHENLDGYATSRSIQPDEVHKITEVDEKHEIVRLDGLVDGWVKSDWVEHVQKPTFESVEHVVEDDYQYIISNVSAMITKNGETAIIHRESPNYKAVVDLLLNEDFENAWAMTSVKKAIEEFSQGKIKVEGDKVFYGTFEVRNRMTDKLIDMVSNGEEGTKAFCSFFEAVMTDIESDHVRDQLWPFIESQCIELNDDGTFTGYRAVRSDYLDKHTGTIDNSVGQVVVMPRHMVNSDPTEPCSAGLHVGSLEYAKGFKGYDDRLMKVKCHVRDVVSVPYDYNAGKLRCCRFEVIKDITDSI